MNEQSRQSAGEQPNAFDLLKKIGGQVRLLMHKEVDLAKAELKASIKNEVIMVSGISTAAVLALLGVNMLLVAAAFALAFLIPGWAASLIIAGVLFLAALVVWLAFWPYRVKSPLVRTTETLKDDLTIPRRKAA